MGGGVVLVLVVVDRVTARRPPREPRRRPERPGGATGTVGGPGFGDLVEIVEPAARHWHEEQERRRHDVVLAADADPDWDLDLERGVASLPPRRDDPPEPEPDGGDVRTTPGR